MTPSEERRIKKEIKDLIAANEAADKDLERRVAILEAEVKAMRVKKQKD